MVREPESSFALFRTAIGDCAIAWSERGLLAVQLPEADRGHTIERLSERIGSCRPAKPPSWVNEAITLLQEHLDGRAQSFSRLKLDLQGVAPFHKLVYEAARKLPPGNVVTYGQLAALAGSPRAARAVGQAMARNPLPLIVPCHRIVATGGQPGGFSAYGGLDIKQKLLHLEGVDLYPNNSEGALAVSSLPFDAAEALTHLSRKDKKLGKIIERVGPLRLELDHLSSPFEALAESIVYQQLTGKAAATIFTRVKALFPQNRLPEPAKLARVAEDRLRSAGLSGAKTEALLDLSRKAAEGLVPDAQKLQSMSDEEIVQILTQVRGIGQWTVEMLLIFRLGRPDVLPATDYGVRKGFARVYKLDDLPTPKELQTYAERWKPYRTVAAWYMWRALELPAG